MIALPKTQITYPLHFYSSKRKMKLLFDFLSRMQKTKVLPTLSVVKYPLQFQPLGKNLPDNIPAGFFGLSKFCIVLHNAQSNTGLYCFGNQSELPILRILWLNCSEHWDGINILQLQQSSTVEYHVSPLLFKLSYLASRDQLLLSLSMCFPGLSIALLANFFRSEARIYFWILMKHCHA